MANNPIVSVHMITYLHENYIRQAIEGVLMQETDFEYDLIVADDCSPDNTNGIVNDIISTHPLGYRIKYFRHEKNLGMLGNGLFGLSKCTGNYVALCEGDDYWTDPYKLQKQVDFLEANPEFIFTFHDAMILNQKTGEKRPRIGERKIDEIVDLKSVILQNNIPTASVVYRNILDYKTLPDWFYNISKGDYGLCVLLAEKGPGKYLTESMSVYRVHEGGVWSGNSFEKTHQADMLFYNYLLKYFTDRDIQKAIRAKIHWTNFNYGISRIRNGSFLRGVITLISNLQLRGDNRVKTSLRKIPGAIKSGIRFWLNQSKTARS